MSKTWNEETQKYEYTPSFVLEFRLLTSNSDEQELEKCFGIAGHINNVMVKEAQRRLGNLFRDKEYKDIMKPYFRTGKFKKGDKKKLMTLRSRYGLTEYSFHKYVDAKQLYPAHIDCNTRQKEATKVWNAVKKVLYSNGQNVHLKKLKNKNSVEGKTNQTGIRYHDRTVFWHDLTMPVRVRKNDWYAKQALDNCEIKYCRIVRRWYKHTYRYYVQLVMEGTPPVKRKRQMIFDRAMKEDTPVGIDIGPSTIAIVSKDHVSLDELASGVTSIEKEVRHLNRLIDKETRLANPDNYNPDGTWKKNNKNRTRNKSHSQIKKEHKRKWLYQKRKNKLRYTHQVLANEIISTFGTDIRIENMNWEALQKKVKKTEKSDKTGRYKRKKRFGKSIQNHAPSMLITLLKQKLGYIHKPLMVIDTYKTKASQFNHITGECKPAKLNERWKEIAPDIFVQRDLYSAFLLMNCDTTETIDIESCFDSFDTFKKEHDACIRKLMMQKQYKKLPSCMGLEASCAKNFIL